MSTSTFIHNRINDLYPTIVQDYQYLHQHPELSFEEYNTSAYIQKVLDSLSIPYRAGIAGTGVLGILKGINPSSKVIALRADMDALPVLEENEIPFCSVNAGVMHACGHDSHVAALLGAARVLAEMRDSFEGTILLVFQPGEEQDPGGARLMLEDGVFDEYEPALILGQHSNMYDESGIVSFCNGAVMASADEIHIKVKGKGGHGAMPHKHTDAVLAAAQVVVAMQQILSRTKNPFTPMSLTFGRFIADGATNVIPHEVVLAGSLRCFDKEEREKAKQLIPIIGRHTAEAYLCEFEIKQDDGYPEVINDDQVTNAARLFAQEYLGTDHVKAFEPRTTSEDFGFYTEKYKGCFFRFGVRNQTERGASHTSTFLIDEESLKTAAGTMAYLAIRFLQ